MAKLIFGCGYLGLRVARLWREAGHVVYAVTRTAERGQVLAAEGLLPLVGDVVAGQKPVIPQDVHTVLFALGNDRRGGQPTTEVYRRGIECALTWMPETVDRFLVISSTGVYSQTGGAWVDETSPAEPTTDGGRGSLAVELAAQNSRFAARTIILRLAGLYGPGRLPKSADILSGRPIEADSDGWLNLIHVEDAARIVVRAESHAMPPRTYLVSDGQPVVRRAFYEELARLLKAPPPRFGPPGEDTTASRRGGSDKRIDSRRVRAELGGELLYPTYRAGLEAIVSRGAR